MTALASVPSEAPGLRARNRARRMRRVERAALELALEHGLDRVTVDMICEASDISPRTYFNYFGTKEGALLGAGPAALEPGAIEEFIASRGHLLEDLLLLAVRSFIATEPDREVFRMRRALVSREPELEALQLGRILGKRQATADVVERRLLSEHPGMPPEEVRTEALLAAGIAQTAFPLLAKAWLESSDGGLDVDAAIHAAVARVRRIVP